MERDISQAFEIHFSGLQDPIIKRKKLYPLMEILFVVLCGAICGAESWRDFVLFGKEKTDFLKNISHMSMASHRRICLPDYLLF